MVDVPLLDCHIHITTLNQYSQIPLVVSLHLNTKMSHNSHRE